MHRHGDRLRPAVVALWFMSVAASGAAWGMEVVGVEPPAHSLSASVHAPVVIHFDEPVMRSSVAGGTALWAFGRWSGVVTGTYEFSNADQTVTLRPDRPFSAGESVMVILSNAIQAADGTPLRAAGYSFQFWTRSRSSSLDFTEIANLTTRTTPSAATQAYGGIASDLDRDGFLDLTIVNEITADLRVFLNKADRSGLFDPFVQPTFGVGNRASPSEPSDFNRDGIVDICVANIGESTVSVLLGVGDGTFGPEQVIPIGTQPRGIAVLDADGDGDVDIAATSSGSSNMWLLTNDGTGSFAAQPPFESGGDGEWSLASADMDDDGILDLVIGAAGSGEIIVSRCHGDGTFSLLSAQGGAGLPWMLGCGDVNGDGTEDVAIVDQANDRGLILTNDGTGALSTPVPVITDDFPLATDLGDMDGDGDLDWVTSSYNGDWRMYLNDGSGGFTFDQSFPSPAAASCALMLDIDNDGDLDLGLIDEVADRVLVMQNGGNGVIPAANGWGLVCLAMLLLTAATVIVRSRGLTYDRY